MSDDRSKVVSIRLGLDTYSGDVLHESSTLEGANTQPPDCVALYIDLPFVPPMDVMWTKDGPTFRCQKHSFFKRLLSGFKLPKETVYQSAWQFEIPMAQVKYAKKWESLYRKEPRD